tara:strand:+ start:6664 stop:7221 length:558 start_codon:yes stop_codon:yes gene_type:complete
MMIKHYDINSTDNRDEALIARAVQYVKKPLWAYFRPMIRGTEHIPEGAGLYVGNHSGGIMTPDSFLFGCEVFEKRGLKDLPFGLTHVTAIKAPLVHQIIVPLGAIKASHQNAHKLFQQGKKVLVYPGGDIDALRPFRDKDRIIFEERRGYIRLALREHVPIIPVISAGSRQRPPPKGRGLKESLC